MTTTLLEVDALIRLVDVLAAEIRRLMETIDSHKTQHTDHVHAIKNLNDRIRTLELHADHER